MDHSSLSVLPDYSTQLPQCTAPKIMCSFLHEAAEQKGVFPSAIERDLSSASRIKSSPILVQSRPLLKCQYLHQSVIHLFDRLRKVSWEHRSYCTYIQNFHFLLPLIFICAASDVFTCIHSQSFIHEIMQTYLYTYLFLVFLEKVWVLLKINPRPLFCCSQPEKGSRTAFSLPLMVLSILLPVAVYSLKGAFEILSNSMLCTIVFFSALWNE